MRSVSRLELEKLLEAKRGASFVTILANTAPELIGGKKNPYYGIRKSSKVNGMLCWSYQNAVNNQRAREGHPEFFEPHPRKWGVRLHDEMGRLMATVAHKDKKYLEIKVQKSLGHSFYLNGELVPNELVHPHLRPESKGRQELESPVILRDYDLNNLRAVRVDGELLVVH